MKDNDGLRRLECTASTTASLGGFEEMNDLIELYDNYGIRCEDLLKKLQDKFLPALDLEKKKAANSFMTFMRGKLSLMEASKKLRVVILECNKYGYKWQIRKR